MMEIEKRDTTARSDRDLPMDKLLAVIIEQSKASASASLIKGIVHNLNGSLQILSMRMELLQRMLVQGRGDTNQAAQEQVEQCLEQIDKFRGLIADLAGKSVHDEKEESESIGVHDLLDESIALMRHNLFFKHQVKVTKKYSSGRPLIQGRYSDLSQGLWTILQNAVEAMEDAPIKELTLATRMEGRQIRIDIQDSGCGVSEKIKESLFQPFITTKQGKHAGLGLFIAGMLLRPYEASFSLSSREGETVFTVHLPASVGRGN